MTKSIPPINLQDRPFVVDEDVLIYAFRYCLGRMTYAVGTMADVLIKNADSFSERARDLFRREISECLQQCGGGMDMDKEQWQRVLARFGPLYTVRAKLPKGEQETHACYLWNGNYYTAMMRSYIAPEYISWINPPP